VSTDRGAAAIVTFPPAEADGGDGPSAGRP
jgi:hypothetical protein